MSLLHGFPYTNFHDLNLDMILEEIKKLMNEFDEFKVINQIHFAGEWNITKQYQVWSIVNVNDFGYIAQKAVPAGISIDNEDYWILVADYSVIMAGFQVRVAALEKELHNLKIANLKDYGAIGDGATDDTQAFINWINSGKNTLYVPEGTYLLNINSTLSISSNTEIIMTKNSIIKNIGDVTLFTLENVTNCKITGGIIEGPDSYTAGNAFGILISNSRHVTVDNVEIRYTNLQGIRLNTSSYCIISNCYIHNNYYYAIETSKGGHHNTFKNNILSYNGYASTGTAFSGGRGIVLSGEHNSIVDSNIITNNSEYGLRLYGDENYSIGCDYIIICNNFLSDNGRSEHGAIVDMYFYYTTACTPHKYIEVYSNIFKRSTNYGTMLSLQGKELSIHDNTFSADSPIEAINCYKADACIIENNKFYNVSTVVFLAGSQVTSCELRNNYAECATVTRLSENSQESKIVGNTFKHIGSGTSDVAITISCTKCNITDNNISGFYRGIVVGGAVTNGIITRNITENNTAGLYLYINSLPTNLQIFNNLLYDETNRESVRNLITARIGLGRRLGYLNQAPTELSWERGDFMFNTNPSNGGKLGWVCIESGSPGTWVGITI